MSIFDNFTETINSDNRFKNWQECDDEDELIIGASCNHVFKVPFLFTGQSAYARDCRIFYSQGLNVVLEKGLEDCEVTPETITRPDQTTYYTGCSIISLDLTPFDTAYFKDTVLDSWVQLKIYTVNDELLYNEKRKIKVIPTLESIDEYESREIQ